MARVTAGCSAKGVELAVDAGHGRLALNKGAAVVAHGLVADVRVLGEDGPEAGPHDHQQDDGREDGVDGEEEDAHDTDCESLLEIVSKLCQLFVTE